MKMTPEEFHIWSQCLQLACPQRSVQHWWKAYLEAEAESECGYLGLLDRVAARGNRTPRVPDASVQLLEAYLQNHYATPQAKNNEGKRE